MQIEQNNEILRPILEKSRDVLYRLNLKTKSFDFISPSVKEVTGYTPEEFIKMGPEKIDQRVHPDDRAIHRTAFEPFKQGRTDQETNPTIEYRLMHKDGHYRWLSNNRTICYDQAGSPVAIVGNVRDITRAKHLRHQLEHSEQKYRGLYENAHVALFRSRIADGSLIECNQMLIKMLGYKNREKCMAEFISSECYVDPTIRQKLLEQLNADGYVENFQAEVRCVDDSTKWFSFAARIFPEKGYLEGAAIDITNLKLLTPAELQVLGLVMQGMSSKQIAASLSRSIRTIEDHRSHIMKKFGASNLIDLVKAALEMQADFEANDDDSQQ